MKNQVLFEALLTVVPKSQWVSLYEYEYAGSPKPLTSSQLEQIKKKGKETKQGWVFSGDLDLSSSELTKFPFKIYKVEGNFSCYNNLLTSLEGGPIKVGGSYNCAYNELTSLKGAPKEVGGDFSCYNNLLTSLEGGPIKVGGSYNCAYNELTSLKGAPKEVGGDFSCEGNQLTTLEGGPVKVGGDFLCYANSLTSLKGAPKEVGGDFNCRSNKISSFEELPIKIGGEVNDENNPATEYKEIQKKEDAKKTKKLTVANRYSNDLVGFLEKNFLGIDNEQDRQEEKDKGRYKQNMKLVLKMATIYTLDKMQKIWNAITHYSSFYYARVNNSLRAGKVPPMALLIDDYIKTAPKFDQDVLYRGVAREEFEKFKEGKIFVAKGFVSTTTKESIARYFSRRRRKGGIIKIENVRDKAAYVPDISNMHSEKEYLLPRNSRFKVVKKEKDIATVVLL